MPSEESRDLFARRLAHARGEGPPPEPEVSAVYIGQGPDDEALFLPVRFDGPYVDEERGLRVDLEGSVVDGEPTCVSLTVRRLDGAPLTAEDLEGLPLRDYLNRIAASRAFVLRKGEKWGSLAALLGAQDAVMGVLPKRRRRVTNDELRQVADVYRAAWQRGDDPTRAVAEHLQQSRATAARKVGRARAKGFLGAAPGPRQAGEVLPHAGRDEATPDVPGDEPGARGTRYTGYVDVPEQKSKPSRREKGKR